VFVDPFVDEGLGNSSYLVGSEETKVGVLIDPLRDVDLYLGRARQRGITIEYVLDSHLHADFISGARELASETGARIGASAEAGHPFPHEPLREGDRVRVGDQTFQILSTPGHTPEHISFLLQEKDSERPQALFSGGALIVGGAARTDLLSPDMTVPLARKLFSTIHEKLLRLPDSVTVYPTHGAGSFCVAPETGERTTSIGLERQRNPLAQPQTEEEFLTRALGGLPSYPTYFSRLRDINQAGPTVLHGIPKLKSLSPEEVKTWVAQGGAVLDVRSGRAFCEGHIPGAYGISVRSPLTTWAGWLIPFGTPLVLVTGGKEEDAAVRQLLRIGYDDLRGTLEGGMPAWEGIGLPVDRVSTVTTTELRERLTGPRPPVVLDVRFDAEWRGGHLPQAVHIENGRLPLEELPWPMDQPIAVHCAHGNRSISGISVLARRGYRNLWFVEGGFSSWAKSGFEVKGEAKTISLTDFH